MYSPDLMFSSRWHSICVAHVLLVINSFLYSVEAHLIYYNGGQLKVIIGWAVPVDVPINVVYAQNIQFQYNTIDNASKFAIVFQEERRLKNPITRSRLIRAIQQHFDRECMLYMICESAAIPIVNSGIIGEIIQTLLTPSDQSDKDLVEAYNKGLVGNSSDIDRCVEQYPQCSFVKTLVEPFFRYSKVYE